MIHNILRSITLLSNSVNCFVDSCIAGLKADTKRIKYYLNNSLMLVTALNPYIGYNKAAQIAKKAHAEGLTLKEATLRLGYLTEEEFDKYVKPENMI